MRELSLQYTQCNITDGLPAAYSDRFDEVMDNRLAPSSRDKMMTGFRRWQAFSLDHGWSPFIESGDPCRAGRIVAWVLDMLDETELTFSSICQYVWGMRTWHVCQHQDDPVYGVKSWREFIRGVAMLSSVPGEPRRQVPLEAVRAILTSLDPSDFEQAQFGLLLLVLLFTFSRTECPCPKTWDGRDNFDPSRHWTASDFRLVNVGGKFVLWVRFKGIKQDPRVERETARHAVEWLPFETEADGRGRDWVPIGDVDDPLFSVAHWYRAFVRALGRAREQEESMFLARDRTRAYTYRCLLADLRSWLGHVGADTTLGAHGLRVLGYNLSKRGNGVELTVAHGGWFSEGHSRYERFSQVAVLGIPAGMLGLQSAYGSAQQAREISRGRAVRGASGLPGAVPVEDLDGYSASDDEEVPVGDFEAVGAADGVPPGYTPVRREYASGARGVWQAPDGTFHQSKPAAWKHFGRTADRARVSPAASPMSAAEESTPVENSPEQLSAHSPARSPARPSSRLVPRRRARVAPVSGSGGGDQRTVHGGEPSSPSEIVPVHERPSLRRPPPERARE